MEMYKGRSQECNAIIKTKSLYHSFKIIYHQAEKSRIKTSNLSSNIKTCGWSKEGHALHLNTFTTTNPLLCQLNFMDIKRPSQS